MPYINTGIHDVKITVSYPYSDFVQYTANVLEHGVESVQDFGTHGYSMIRTDFLYDADSMMLDSYIDQCFTGRIFEFDPTYLKRIWVTRATSITAKSVDKIIPMYRYTNHPITIKAGTELIMMPGKIADEENPFASVKEHNWKWSANMYDDSDYLEQAVEHRFRHHAVFKCQNEIISIRPDTVGVNDVEMSCYDPYGNRLVTNSEALVYIN